MALSLNTGHALYSNILACICVDDDNTVKDLKGNQTCTKDASCSIISSSGWGRAFRTVFSSSNAKGVSLSPGLQLNLTSQARSVFIATNSINSIEGVRYMALNAVVAQNWSPSVSGVYYPRLYSTDAGGVLSGSSAINSGTHSWGGALDRTAANLSRSFADGSTVATGTASTLGSAQSGYTNYIGGETGGGYGGVAADYVWVVFFNKYLSSTEVSDLHSSLGASNAFALVSAAATNVTMANVSQSTTVTATAVYQSAVGTLTTAPLKNNAGTLLANQTGATAYVHNMTTGALVVAKTGQTTNSSGVMTVTDAQITPSTQYRIVVKLASAAEGLDKLTAT